MYINELRIKKVGNIVLQSSKHEKTTFLQAYICFIPFSLVRYYQQKNFKSGWLGNRI